MHFTTITSAATLLALAPAALAVGCARVVNNCPSSLYFASVAQSKHADMAEFPSSGYEETYSLPNVGVSIKLSPSSSGKVTQFEYTWVGPNVYFDISNIDGFPFHEGGMSLVPSEAGAEGYPTCQPVICEAGVEYCDMAYNLPDDVRTMVCPDTTDLVMTLCPNATSSNTTPSTPSESSTAPSEPASTPNSGRPSWVPWWHNGKREAEVHSHGHRVHARHIPRK